MSRLLNGVIDNVRRIVQRSFASFAQKDFLYEDHSHSGTLVNRFAQQIALDNSHCANIVRNSIKYSQFYPVHNHDKFQLELQNVPNNQLIRIVMFTANYRSNADVSKFFKVINILDNEVESRIKDLDYRELKELMLMFMYLLPNKFADLDFAKSGTQKLLLDFSKNSTKEDFLQICFYIGLLKKSQKYREHLKSHIKMHLTKYIDDLNSVQFALVVNSAFKCSVTIPDEDFKQKLIAEVLNMNNDVDLQILVTLAKSLRQNKIKNDEVLDKVQHLLEMRKIRDIDLRGYAHLFSLFAECRRIPKNIMQVIVSDCMRIIRLEHEKSINISRKENAYHKNPNFRPKDLTSFLWGCTNLPEGALSHDDLNLLTTVIIWKLRNYEYKYEYDNFVDTLQSLMFLDCKSDILIKAFFNEKKFLIPPKNHNRLKLDSRQMLLTTCFEIETPEIVPIELRSYDFKNPVDVPIYLLEKRPGFLKIGEILQTLLNELGIVKIDCKIPVRNINLPSYQIEIQNRYCANSKIWIEILDKHTTMDDFRTPTPIIRLKWRLMRSMNLQILSVFTEGRDEEILADNIRKAVKEHLFNMQNIDSNKGNVK